MYRSMTWYFARSLSILTCKIRATTTHRLFCITCLWQAHGRQPRGGREVTRLSGRLAADYVETVSDQRGMRLHERPCVDHGLAWVNAQGAAVYRMVCSAYHRSHPDDGLDPRRGTMAESAGIVASLNSRYVLEV